MQKLYEDLLNNTYQFFTLLGDDFIEEVEEHLRELKSNPPQKKKKGISFSNKKVKDSSTTNKAAKSLTKINGVSSKKGKDAKALEDYDPAMQLQIMEELKRQERKRKITVFVLSILATACMAYVGIYYY